MNIDHFEKGNINLDFSFNLFLFIDIDSTNRRNQIPLLLTINSEVYYKN